MFLTNKRYGYSKIFYPMLKYFPIFLVKLFLILIPGDSTGQSKAATKKLIEFGWDYPTADFLENNIRDMEKSPFDGVCFSIEREIYNAFDTTQFADAKFRYNELQNINWKKFTENFLIIRGASYSGAHWLDDKSWNKISLNLRKLSRALVIAKAKGIGFDAEYYFKDSTLNPWVYKPDYYNNLSYQEVGTYVRKRGKQFIQALQVYKPDIKILCFWLLGLVYSQKQVQPIEETRMALYPFFIEGMLQGQNGLSEIIDGNESSYTYQSFVPFVFTGQRIRGVQSGLIREDLQPNYKRISIAQAIYLDLLYPKTPKFDAGFDKEKKEQWLKDNLYFAFKTTDKYVWFYNERINWWKNEVDAGISEIITEVKTKLKKELNNNSPLIEGESSVIDFKKTQFSTYRGILYNYQKNKKLIHVKLLKNNITNVQVYKNSLLIYDMYGPPADFNIDLKGKDRDGSNIIILAKDSNGIYSVAFLN